MEWTCYLTRAITPSLNKWRHSFYGGYPGIVEVMAGRLKYCFPGLQITGTISPSFRNPTPDEDEATIRQIYEFQPDILWVGLGCPKQELLDGRTYRQGNRAGDDRRWRRVRFPLRPEITGPAFDPTHGAGMALSPGDRTPAIVESLRQYPLFALFLLLQAIGITRYD